MNDAAILCAGLLCLLLARAAWGDVRARDIPNWIPLAIALLAPAWWWADGVAPWPALAWRVGTALALFAVMFLAWTRGMIGGGDVKLLAALALWFAPLPLVGLLTVMALAGGVVTVATVAGRHLRRRPDPPEVPYGVAIAFAGAWAMANAILTTPMR